VELIYILSQKMANSLEFTIYLLPAEEAAGNHRHDLQAATPQYR